MRNPRLFCLAIVASLILPVPALAIGVVTIPIPVTYNVNLSGNGETLTGTITTDGATGLLQASDILGFNLSAAGAISLDVNSNTMLFSCPFTGGCELQSNGNQLIATTQGLTTQSEIDFNRTTIFNDNSIRIASDPGPTFVDTQVIVFSPSGSPLVMINDPGAASLVVGTVAAVPEPQTYALMLAGLGLVGFVARRRKQRAD